MKFLYVLLVLPSLSSLTLAVEREKGRYDRDRQFEPVTEVSEVTLKGSKVIANGVVSSAGWKNPRLEPFKEEADGIYRFKFEAEPPDKVEPRTVTATGTVEFDFETLPANLHKVVVEGERNEREVLYTGGAGNSESKRKAAKERGEIKARGVRRAGP